MKFKNAKKKKVYKKSPSNSRSIPEAFKFRLPKFNHALFVKIYHDILKIFVVFIFMVAAVAVGYDLYRNLKENRQISSQREILLRELDYWNKFISKHNNYKDAYFQAAILEYRLRDTNQAKIYVKKGLSLDPSSPDGRKIEELLNK